MHHKCPVLPKLVTNCTYIAKQYTQLKTDTFRVTIAAGATPPSRRTRCKPGASRMAWCSRRGREGRELRSWGLGYGGSGYDARVGRILREC